MENSAWSINSCRECNRRRHNRQYPNRRRRRLCHLDRCPRQQRRRWCLSTCVCLSALQGQLHPLAALAVVALAAAGTTPHWTWPRAWLNSWTPWSLTGAWPWTCGSPTSTPTAALPQPSGLRCETRRLKCLPPPAPGLRTSLPPNRPQSRIQGQAQGQAWNQTQGPPKSLSSDLLTRTSRRTCRRVLSPRTRPRATGLPPRPACNQTRLPQKTVST
mmetsp:Transcript_13020/g.26561  ORF Transcript_13020/g.26561 Transcript_13020/m.26561 type:complete len:216 (-) Transcript_13020:862-1509(-)